MSMQCEYYLSCDTCDKIYDAKYDDPQSVEDEAIDDGWEVCEDKKDIEQSTHICSKCITKK